MRISLTLLLLLMIVTSAISGSGADGSSPAKVIPDKFESYPELKEWAEGSTLGGGILIKLEDDTSTYFVADRVHTSGMATSEAIFYKQVNKNFLKVYYLPLIYGTRNYAILKGKIAILEKTFEGKENRIILKTEDF